MSKAGYGSVAAQPEVYTPTNWEKIGEVQTPTYKDVPFAIAFLAHLAVMIYIRCQVDDPTPLIDSDVEVTGDQYGFVVVLALCSVGFAIGMFYLIQRMALILIQASIIGSVVFSVFFGISMIMVGNILTIILGVLCILGSIWYAKAAWKYAAYSAANLETAIAAILDNLGLCFMGIASSAVSLLWTVMWCVVFNAVLQGDKCMNNDDDDCDEGGFSILFYFLLLISYFWTILVLQYIVQVTVAGVIGTWWTAPAEADSCCSTAVIDSTYRSMTYSFGSICMGSLLLAVVKALRATTDYLRDQQRSSDEPNAIVGILLCCAECILRMLEGILEYFNQWAFSYIGLYGYSYLDAGKGVVELFQSRGWTTYVTEDIASNVTFFGTLMTGVLTGGLGVLLNSTSFHLFEDSEDASKDWIAFGVAGVTGLVIGGIMMNIVSGAVNTVIVCMAEMPDELQANHPKYSQAMRYGWLKAFPSCGLKYDVVV